MFWEENHDMKFGKEFLNMTPKAQSIKAKNDKLPSAKLEISP